jgi:hypothetical protein
VSEELPGKKFLPTFLILKSTWAAAVATEVPELPFSPIALAGGVFTIPKFFVRKDRALRYDLVS